MTAHAAARAGSRSPGGARRPRLTVDVAPGIHQLEHGFVNSYLVTEGDSVTLVDTGLPTTWPHLVAALGHLGRQVGDIHAVVLTHAHFDHLGVADRLRRQGTPVWLHPGDRRIARHPYRYAHERARLAYPLAYPAARPLLARMARAGALWVRGVGATVDLATSGEVDVPGRPTVVFSPGHTDGHTALHFPGRGALLSGDALVTLDPYTGGRGPQIVAGAATADSEQALASLRALAATDAALVLPGHGTVWRQGIASAVERALATGAH